MSNSVDYGNSLVSGPRKRGPKTPEGKLRSSMNAIKTGKYARTAYVLRHEDRDAFERFVEIAVRRLQPRDALEYHYIRQLAFVEWRMLRNCTLDAAVHDREFLARSNALAQVAERFPQEEPEVVSNALRFAMVVENMLTNSKLPAYISGRESQLTYYRNSLLQTLQQLKKAYPLSEQCSQITDLEHLSVDNSFENEFESNSPQDDQEAA